MFRRLLEHDDHLERGQPRTTEFLWSFEAPEPGCPRLGLERGARIGGELAGVARQRGFDRPDLPCHELADDVAQHA